MPARFAMPASSIPHLVDLKLSWDAACEPQTKSRSERADLTASYGFLAERTFPSASVACLECPKAPFKFPLLSRLFAGLEKGRAS